ncbi:CapA family protein [Novosphingobium humi]|uniref:CapA family protein n=1 Tax=Novosphingobium humi TaxID=2282397 RepID=A0ABY7U1S5_9SPHN|nr:CapA family protein [Novosphingobium humi]WCT79266.1 CapA family protein [Novosphingobium humi]
MSKRSSGWRMCVASALTIGAMLGAHAHAQVASNVGYGARKFDGSSGVPRKPDQAKELALKITQPFSVASVGDLLQFQPFATSNDPAVRAAIEPLRKADVTTGDFENEIMDFDNFAHAGGNLATKEVADDWRLMGIDLVSRANNKDPRAPGVWNNLKEVERVGITHAGIAHSLPEARMARYFATPKGLVGFAGIYALGGLDACCAGGTRVHVSPAQLAGVRAMKAAILARRDEIEVPVPLPAPDADGEAKLFGLTFTTATVPSDEPMAKPALYPGDGPPGPEDGIRNSLRLTLFHGVTAAQMVLLRDIAGQPGTGDLKAFGTQFRVMDRPGEHSFDMNPQDLREILTQIRTAKQASDVLVTNIHWHQNRYDFQAYSYDHFPADFEIKFAHMAVDQGVDVFVGQGVHTLKGIEIYKGKPIFYGTSNFIFQSAIMPLPKGHYPGQKPGEGAFHGPFKEFEEANAAANATGGPIVGEHEFQGFWQLKPTLESYVAYTNFDGGKLKEVVIYPVDLGQTPRPGSQVGIPRKPSPEVAKKILDEIVEYSKPFGTVITIEDGVGYIRFK